MKLITFIRFYYLSICKGVSVSDVFCVDVWIQFTYYRLNIGYCYSDLGIYLHDYEITKFTKPLLVWANESSSNFCSMLLLFMSVGWDYDPELQPPTSLLFFPLVICDYGEPLWKDINRAKPKKLGESHVPMQLCPPQISHRLTRVRTLASAVRGRRLTA
jgi:hypothetical protein